MPATATDRLAGLTTSVAVKSPCTAVTAFNIPLTGLFTVNGVALQEGDRVLVRAQTDAAANGIYNASTSDWTRALDFDGPRDVVIGTLVLVRNQIVQGAMYELLANSESILIDDTEITFELRDDPTILYAQTQQEIDAGVMPVRTIYPPGNVLRHGFSISASAAVNAAALLSAIAVIGASGGEIIIPAGTYHIAADTVTFPYTNVTLTGAGTGMGYAAATAGTTLLFGAGTVGFNCTQETGGGGGGNYTLIREMSVSGNNVCQYPIKIKGVVLLDDLTVTGSTAAGAGIWLFDLVNSTRLNRVSAFGNNGYGIVVGGLGTGAGQNTLATMNNCTIRENLVGIRIEQITQFTMRDTVIESNIHEGIFITQPAGQACGNLEFDSVWLENNWQGGSAARANLVIDSPVHNFTDGPPSYVKFTNSKFSATGSTMAIDIEALRYGLFENCSGTGLVTLGAYASYVGFFNWNGGSITDGGNRNWTGLIDGNNIGGPSYSALNAQKLQVGYSGTPIVNKVKGTAVFAAATSVAVLFPTQLPAGGYQISFAQSATSPLPPWFTAKQPTGFTINFSASFTGQVDWIVEQ